MKIRTVFFLIIAPFAGLVGCQQLGDSGSERAKAEIEASMKQAAKAWEDFPKSLDRTSILKHFAMDYSGVKDGTAESLEDLAKSFDDLAEQVKLGNTIGISYKITDLKVQPFTGSLALLTYQDENKFGKGGVLLRDVKAKCTTLVRKEGETWLVFHEHCSTMSG